MRSTRATTSTSATSDVVVALFIATWAFSPILWNNQPNGRNAEIAYCVGLVSGVLVVAIGFVSVMLLRPTQLDNLHPHSAGRDIESRHDP